MKRAVLIPLALIGLLTVACGPKATPQSTLQPTPTATAQGASAGA
jgi:hypothetical protein